MSKIDDETRLQHQELTIANLNVKVARLEKRISDLQAMDRANRSYIETLRRQLGKGNKSAAEKVFRHG